MLVCTQVNICYKRLSDHELCYSTSKSIGDEEDTLKSFMGFDITPRVPVFRVVVKSQIVVTPTIFPSQWHSRLEPMTLTLIPFVGPWVCHSISKSIGHKKDILKSFMAFGIIPHGPVFRMVVGSQIVAPPH